MIITPKEAIADLTFLVNKNALMQAQFFYLRKKANCTDIFVTIEKHLEHLADITEIAPQSEDFYLSQMLHVIANSILWNTHISKL